MSERLPYDNKSLHQCSVEVLLRGIGHQVPDCPQVPARKARLSQGRLLLEETLELLAEVGLELVLKEGQRNQPLHFADFELICVAGDEAVQLPELIKELADVSVIATGFMSLCGVADMSVLQAVDNNNLLKIATGKRNPQTGKFEKAPGHPKPDIAACLWEQGWPGPLAEGASHDEEGAEGPGVSV
jgi:predicted HAD superfamily Cof-like phosphohydrolase